MLLQLAPRLARRFDGGEHRGQLARDVALAIDEAQRGGVVEVDSTGANVAAAPEAQAADGGGGEQRHGAAIGRAPARGRGPKVIVSHPSRAPRARRSAGEGVAWCDDGVLALVRQSFVVLLAFVASGCVSIADYEPDVRIVLGRTGDVVALLPNEVAHEHARRKGMQAFSMWNAADPRLATARGTLEPATDFEFVSCTSVPTIRLSWYGENRLNHGRRLSRFDGISIGLVDAATLERVGLEPAGEYRYRIVPRDEFEELLARGPGPLVVAGRIVPWPFSPRVDWFGIDDWTRSRTTEVIIDPALFHADPTTPPESRPPG